MEKRYGCVHVVVKMLEQTKKTIEEMQKELELLERNKLSSECGYSGYKEIDKNSYARRVYEVTLIQIRVLKAELKVYIKGKLDAINEEIINNFSEQEYLSWIFGFMCLSEDIPKNYYEVTKERLENIKLKYKQLTQEKEYLEGVKQ